MVSAGTGVFSKSFFDLIKSIGEARSKQEEDRIMSVETVHLKEALNQPTVPHIKLKEYLIRAVYVEMLGHDASFAYIHAVKCSQSRNLMCKFVGYLVSSLFLGNRHELLVLLINTIKKDMGSFNYMEVASALNCVIKVLNDEIIPAVFPEIVHLLQEHPHKLIKRKCLLVLHAIFRLQPDLIIEDTRELLKKSLCDPDPSIMSASLYVIHAWAKIDRETWADTVPMLVAILKQIIGHALPQEFDYHRVAAPWIQIQLLDLLAVLGEGDKNATDEMSEVLAEVLRRAEYCGSVGFAIVFECVRTLTSIAPTVKLLDMAATAISRFISSNNHNLKYVGITALANIVRVHPTFAAKPEHQLIVVDCLEDADDTLRRRTLELLFKMSNPKNVTAVVDKLLYHLKLTAELEFRRDLALKICHLADYYSPSHRWYVEIISEVLESSEGTLIPISIVHNFFRLIADGPTGYAHQDALFRDEVVSMYLTNYIHKYEKLPELLIKVMTWTIGEHGKSGLSDKYSTLDSLMAILAQILMRNSYSDPLSTRHWVFSAIMKLSMKRLLTIGSNPLSAFSSKLSQPTCEFLTEPVREVIAFCVMEHPGTYLEEQCLSFRNFVNNLRVDVSIPHAKDLLDDLSLASTSIYEQRSNGLPSLEFLQKVVKDQEQLKATPFVGLNHAAHTFSLEKLPTPTEDSTITNLDWKSKLKLEPYNYPFELGQKKNIYESVIRNDNCANLLPTTNSSMPGNIPHVELRVQGPRHWGPQGYIINSQPTSEKTTKSPFVVLLDTAAKETKQDRQHPLPISVEHLRERQKVAQLLFEGLSLPKVTPVTDLTISEKGSIQSMNDHVPALLDSADSINEGPAGKYSAENAINFHYLLDTRDETDYLTKSASPLWQTKKESKKGESHDLIPVDELENYQNSDKSHATFSLFLESRTKEFGMATEKLTLKLLEVEVMWMNLPFETKFWVVFNFCIIEIIDAEGIAAAQVVSSENKMDSPFPVLLHAKILVAQSKAHIILKSSSSSALNHVRDRLQAKIQDIAFSS